MDEQTDQVVTPDIQEVAPDAPVDAPAAPIVDVPQLPDSTPETDVDIAPQDIPTVHQDDGSIGRELDHIVQQ